MESKIEYLPPAATTPIPSKPILFAEDVCWLHPSDWLAGLMINAIVILPILLFA